MSHLRLEGAAAALCLVLALSGLCSVANAAFCTPTRFGPRTGFVDWTENECESVLLAIQLFQTRYPNAYLPTSYNMLIKVRDATPAFYFDFSMGKFHKKCNSNYNCATGYALPGTSTAVLNADPGSIRSANLVGTSWGCSIINTVNSCPDAQYLTTDPCATVNCGANGVCSSGWCYCSNGWSGMFCEQPPADYSVCEQLPILDLSGRNPFIPKECNAIKMALDHFYSFNPYAVLPSSFVLIVKVQGEVPGLYVKYDSGSFRRNSNANYDIVTGYGKAGTSAAIFTAVAGDFQSFNWGLGWGCKYVMGVYDCPPAASLPQDLCRGVNCGAHGSCSAGECHCSDNWSGQFCEIPDPCISVDCGSHGTCVNGQCECSDYWSGDHCETDPCLLIDCGAHGTCNGGNCTCHDLWSGPFCDLDPCHVIECGDYGICIPATAACACTDGFYGDHCQYDPCDGIDCGEFGSCWAGVCSCSDGYTGSRCDVPPGPCYGVDCGAHGSCFNGTCTCRNAWYGTNCEINPCAGVTCPGTSACYNAVCHCDEGYTGATCSTPPPAGKNCLSLPYRNVSPYPPFTERECEAVQVAVSKFRFNQPTYTFPSSYSLVVKVEGVTPGLYVKYVSGAYQKTCNSARYSCSTGYGYGDAANMAGWPGDYTALSIGLASNCYYQQGRWGCPLPMASPV